MQTTQVKAEVENRQPIVLPPAPAAEPPAVPASEKPQDSRAATEEDSSCAAPSGRGRWRPWLVGGAVVVPIALYGGWDWLAATGLATILIGVLPCVAMCALGLCMGRGKSKGEMTLADIRKTYETNSAEPPRHS